jgi:hypothetical protein
MLSGFLMEKRSLRNIYEREENGFSDCVVHALEIDRG